MFVKKSFGMADMDEEKKFLSTMAKDGYIVQKIDSQGYSFKKSSPYSSPFILIEFFEIGKDFDLIYYVKEGFDFLYERKTEKGSWLYYIGEGDFQDLKKREDDYLYAIKKLSDRISVFYFVISVWLGIYSGISYSRSKNPFYFIVIILSFGLLVYSIFKRKTLEDLIKKENK